MIGSSGTPITHPAIRHIPAVFIFKQPRIVLIHNNAEKVSHMIPLALLYDGISAISSSLTVLPDQNHMGFSLFQAYIPSPVKSILTGIIMTSQIITLMVHHFLSPSIHLDKIIVCRCYRFHQFSSR